MDQLYTDNDRLNVKNGMKRNVNAVMSYQWSVSEATSGAPVANASTLEQSCRQHLVLGADVSHQPCLALGRSQAGQLGHAHRPVSDPRVAGRTSSD